MSVQDVAAVDRLNSLRRSKKKVDNNLSVKTEISTNSGNRSPYHVSLPTSPIKDTKSDADTLRRAMARHQASLSRPESPHSTLNDDLPTTSHKYSTYNRLPPISSPVFDQRTSASPSLRRRDGYRTVSSTGLTTSVRSRNTPGLEETKTSLRNSQLSMNEIGFTSSSSNTLPNIDKTRSLFGDGSPDDLPELSTNRYPYLSNSTYSLPRSHRLHKSNRQFAASLRESQESLLSSSRENLITESRESLLKRYPSSSLRSTPITSPDRFYSEKRSSRHGSVTCSSPLSSRGSSPKQNLKCETPFKLQTSFSQNSFPSKIYNSGHSLRMESESEFERHTYRPTVDQYDAYTLHQKPSSPRSSRKNSPAQNRAQSIYLNDPLMYRKSAPVSPAYSLRSSRAASPTNSWRSSKANSPTNSIGCGISYSRKSSRAASPTISQQSSRATSPTNSMGSSVIYNSRRSSRASSPTKSWRSSRANSPSNSIGSGIIYSRRSSKTTSPTNSRESSRATSPTNSIGSERYHSKKPSRDTSAKHSTSLERSCKAEISANGDSYFMRSCCDLPTVDSTVPHAYSQDSMKKLSSINPFTAASHVYPPRPLDVCFQPAHSKTASPTRSVRSSREGSIKNCKQTENVKGNTGHEELVLVADAQAAPQAATVIYVRETFQVVPAGATIEYRNCTGVCRSEHETCNDTNRLSQVHDKDISEWNVKSGKPSSNTSKGISAVKDNIYKESDEELKISTDVSNHTRDNVDKYVNADLDSDFSLDDHEHEDTRSVGTQESGASSKNDKSVNVDLTHVGISNIEDLLQSLTRRVRDVERNDRNFGRVNDLADNDDSARAESVASFVSSASSRGRVKENERANDGETHSVIRRQSVIIEGLTLETEELRKKCQVMEDELVTPVVEDLHQKLGKVEGKLEETETYCYQVVEENVELKSEIETLESEISEVQDTFREKDAKEFKKVKWELENLAKTCRNLQIKLGKAQAKASRLRQEKEEIEETQREQILWKSTAVVAAAALAAYHLITRYK